MRRFSYSYSRTHTYGTFSFGQYQLYVCDMHDERGNSHKGVALLPFLTPTEVPYPLSSHESDLLAVFLRSAANGRLPQRHCLRWRSANHFQPLYLDFTEILDGKLRGKIAFANTIWPVLIPCSIVLACADSVHSLHRKSG